MATWADILAAQGEYNWAALQQQGSLARASMSNARSIAGMQVGAQKSIANLQAKTQRYIAEGGWEVQRESIAAQLKIGMAQLDFQKKRLEELEIPTLRLQELIADREYELAKRAADLADATLGFEVLQFEAQLGGPDNWVQASNFARGVRTSGMASFVQDLMKNQQGQGRAFGATAGVAPDRVTLNSLATKLSQGTQGGGPNAGPYGGGKGGPGGPAGARMPGAATGEGVAGARSTYAGIQSVLLGGAHRLAPGTLEDLDDTELQMMSSVAHDIGMGREGFQRWLRDYNNSRVGTENPALA